MAKPKKKYSNLTKTEIQFIKKKLGITKIQDVDTCILKKLKERLKDLRDSRMKNMVTYKLWDVVMCVILASFAANNTWTEIYQFVDDNYKWLKSFLQMTGGIPKEDTYERIMSLVEPEELNHILFDFFQTLTFSSTPETELLNFDGRVNNGSKRKSTFSSTEVKPLNCLNCYSNKYQYCIETIAIGEKTNEIPMIETLIKGMNLEGTIATWDALNSQTANVKAVKEAHGDYIIPIKGNQGTFLKDLEDYFDSETLEMIMVGKPNTAYDTELEKNHSSLIKYEYFQTSDIQWYSKKEDWVGLESIGMVRKTITKQGKEQKKMETKVEKRYYISSKPVQIKEFAYATREHWAVENKIHWHLDVTFQQDKNSTLNKKALFNLEIIHKFVLATLQRVKSRYQLSLPMIRKHLSNNYEEFFPEFVCYLLLN